MWGLDYRTLSVCPWNTWQSWFFKSFLDEQMLLCDVNTLSLSHTSSGSRPSCWCRWPVPCSTTGCHRTAARPRSAPRGDVCQAWPRELRWAGGSRKLVRETLEVKVSLFELRYVYFKRAESTPSCAAASRCRSQPDIDCNRGQGETLTVHLHPVGPQRCHRLRRHNAQVQTAEKGALVEPCNSVCLQNTFLMAVQSSRMSRSCSM